MSTPDQFFFARISQRIDSENAHKNNQKVFWSVYIGQISLSHKDINYYQKQLKARYTFQKLQALYFNNNQGLRKKATISPSKEVSKVNRLMLARITPHFSPNEHTAIQCFMWK
jgi:hypothetical protein